MTLPPELSHGRLGELAGATGEQPEPAAEPAPAAAGSPVRRILGKGATAARVLREDGVAGVRSLARQRVSSRVRGEMGRRMGPQLREVIDRQVQPVSDLAQAASSQAERASAQVTELRQAQAEVAILERGVQAAEVNQELLKGEFRALLAQVDELGMALAPGTGLAGAGARIAELREKVNAVERRVRLLDHEITGLRASAPAPGAAASRPVADGTGDLSVDAAAPLAGGDGSGPASDLFDYVGFERRFRGDAASVLSAQRERYLDLLSGGGTVVDVGCGRGELLEVLAGQGLDVVGVDTDPGMVAEARDRGLTVFQESVIDYLRRTPEQSLGAIFSAHLAEHLELDVLLEFISLSASRLRPGGVFIAETPNPASLIVLGNSYILDPTHVRPLHPSLFSFLCEGAGFRSVDLRFYSPAEGYRLPKVDHPEHPDWAERIDQAFSQLNEVLFGPQEYAVVAHTPPE
ncbi:MAG: methyltransferase domain-containing protein [Actinomycetales bacterium]